MISNDLHGMLRHDMTHPSSHLIGNLSSSRYYLFLHLVSFYTFLDFYLDIVDMLVPWMSLGTRNIRKYKIQSSDISSAGNTRSHAVAAVARCCWLLLAAVGSQLQASKHFRVRKIISELRHGAVARPGAWSWNNGKEVARWGVAEIQKMSPSTTGRCK